MRGKTRGVTLGNMVVVDGGFRNGSGLVFSLSTAAQRAARDDSFSSLRVLHRAAIPAFRQTAVC